MINYNLSEAKYSVSGLREFSLSEAMRFWKAKFETIKHFMRDVITHPGLDDLGKFVELHWESILPINTVEALQEKNMEKRRVMFDCIGVTKIFQELKPDLLDKQTIHKNRTRWNDQLQPYQHEYDDTYELFKIKGSNLFSNTDSSNKLNDVYAVRCWCTTTAREYWIYVPEEIALGLIDYSEGNTPDAIRAIAWTIRIDISNPKRIYRQGDVIIVEESEDSKPIIPIHLTKQLYLDLMFSET